MAEAEWPPLYNAFEDKSLFEPAFEMDPEVEQGLYPKRFPIGMFSRMRI
jgi:hypothetical protein